MISSLDQHYEKLKSSFMQSAWCYIKRYEEWHGRYPNVGEMGLYNSIFVDKTEDNMKRYFATSAIPFAIKNMPKKYDTVEEFLKGEEFYE